MLLLRAARMARLAAKYRDPAWITRSEFGWIHRYRGGFIITESLHGAPLRILQDNTRDLFFHHYTPRPGDTVVELGAEYGTETLFLSRAVGPTGRVVSVEAHPTTCAALQKVVTLNGLNNVTVIHAAVGDCVGTVTISDGPAISNNVGGGDLKVPAITLRALLSEHGIDEVDLLKVNIEGAERPLLESLVDEDAARIRHAVISCHDFKADRGQGENFRTGSDVDYHLERLGFTWTMRDDHPQVWGRQYRYASR